MLQQLPNVISSLDAFMDSSLQSASQIKTVTQLLSNMENTQLRSILPASRLQKDQKNSKPGELGVDWWLQWRLCSQTLVSHQSLGFSWFLKNVMTEDLLMARLRWRVVCECAKGPYCVLVFLRSTYKVWTFSMVSLDAWNHYLCELWFWMAECNKSAVTVITVLGVMCKFCWLIGFSTS